MIYCRVVTHTIKSGDTLYLLARQYHTTVPAIMLMNPGVNPYNLQVGTRLKICMGEDQMAPQRPQMNERELWEDMRKAWMLQGNMAQMYMDSQVFGTTNGEAVRNRFAQIPQEITEIFRMYYPGDTADRMQSLMDEQVMLMDTLFQSQMDENMQGTQQAVTNLNNNATATAELLSNVNPELERRDLERMMRMNVDTIQNGMEFMLQGKYPEAIMIYEKLLSDMLKLADYLSNGIIEQFYEDDGMSTQ